MIQVFSIAVIPLRQIGKTYLASFPQHHYKTTLNFHNNTAYWKITCDSHFIKKQNNTPYRNSILIFKTINTILPNTTTTHSTTFTHFRTNKHYSTTHIPADIRHIQAERFKYKKIYTYIYAHRFTTTCMQAV